MKRATVLTLEMIGDFVTEPKQVPRKQQLLLQITTNDQVPQDRCSDTLRRRVASWTVNRGQWRQLRRRHPCDKKKRVFFQYLGLVPIEIVCAGERKRNDERKRWHLSLVFPRPTIWLSPDLQRGSVFYLIFSCSMEGFHQLETLAVPSVSIA